MILRKYSTYLTCASAGYVLYLLPLNWYVFLVQAVGLCIFLRMRAQVCVCLHWFGALAFVLRAGSFTSDFNQKSLLWTCEFVNLPLCVSQVLDLGCCLFPLVQ